MEMSCGVNKITGVEKRSCSVAEECRVWATDGDDERA